jgi:hypothetical protein
MIRGKRIKLCTIKSVRACISYVIVRKDGGLTNTLTSTNCKNGVLQSAHSLFATRNEALITIIEASNFPAHT